jgi:Kdo2-lipid IVA lauroyltransferase/acyltransferase
MVAGLGKRLSWRIEALGHSLVAAFMRILPAEDVFGLGEFIGKALWPLVNLRRRTIVRNLRVACAPIDPVEADQMARESFIRTVANLLSSSISSNARGGKIEEILSVENPEILEQAIAEGRGVVILLAHMGNWELLTRLNHFFPKGTKSGAFYRPLNNLILNERVLKMREADGTRLFSKRDSLHQVGGFLRDNGVIGILADQRVGRQGEVVRFFGRLTRVSPLPSLLVRRCKSEVLALSLRTVAPGKWSARYHQVEKPHHSENCMKALEEAMKVSLIDVFWLQERWKFHLKKRITPKMWIGKEGVRGTKPHRAMFWLESGEELPELQDDFLHVDIEWEFVSGKHPQELEEIDRSKPLPIDFIISSRRNNELIRAGRDLGIPVVSLSSYLKIPHKGRRIKLRF